jgi:glycosyltransferase involved in cell wall biosynthesis
MIKILHIIPTLNKGGAERLTIDICNQLAKRDDCEVKLILLRNEIEYSMDFHFKYIITNSNVKLSLIKKNQYQLDEINDIINDFKPNVIHSHLFEAEILSRAYLFRGITYVSHVHDNIIQFEKFKFLPLLKSRITNLYEKYWLINRYKRCRNYFISISNDAYSFVNQNLTKKSFIENKLIFNAIDFNKFYNVNNLSRPIDTIKIVSVGSLVDKKNQILLVEIAQILKNLNLDFTIDILGEGPNRNKIQEYIDQLGLKTHVFLHGNVEEVEHFLSASTYFMHTALYEPFGLVILEAMAAGLPVISLDGKGNRDLIIDGENGFMIHQNNPQLFVDQLLKLHNDKALYRDIQKNSIEFSKKYNIENYTNELLKFYKSIV